MAFNFGSFMGGFAQGVNQGKQIKGAFAEGDLAKEADKLNKKMADSGKVVADEGGGLSQAMPDLQSAQKFADYNNSIASQDAATFGGGLSSAPVTTVTQNPTYTRANYYSDMGSKAASLGLSDKADKYQQMADQQTNNDLNQQVQKQQITKNQMAIDQAKAAQESQQRLDSFYAGVDKAHQDASQNGGTLSWDQIQQMGRDAGLKPDEVLTAASKLTGLDEAGTKYTAGMRVAQFDKAYHTGGIQAVLDMYHTNPLFNDGNSIEAQTGKDGTVTLTSGGNKLFSGTNAEAAVFMRNQLTDPYSAVKFNMEVLQNNAKLQAAASKLKVDQANINQSNAAAAGSLANAAKARQETNNLKTAGAAGGLKPADIRLNTQAAVKQVLLATGLAKQDPLGNLFMQSADGKPASTSEQDIANLSAAAEAYVRQGVPPYQAAQQVIKDRAATRQAAQPPANRPPLSAFGK